MREQLQQAWSDLFCNKAKLGHKKWILNLYQRTGKIKTSLEILRKLDLLNKNILVSYPDNKILDAWLGDIEKFNIRPTNITFTNTASLGKYSHIKYDVFIFDECTDFSEKEAFILRDLIKHSEYVIGLSGTISERSEELLDRLGLTILIKYSNEDAIRDGLISDYEIEIIQVPLSTFKNIKNKKGKLVSEKQQFDNYTYVMARLKDEGKSTKFLALHRNRVLLGSQAKINKLSTLLKNSKDERILVFTGLTKVADALGIPSYHSKSKDKTVFDRFLKQEFNHMAVAKIGGSGVTYPSLDRVILSSFTYDEEDTSQIISRCMVLDYKGKIAKIIILTSNEEAELKKLRATLADFDRNKIKWK